ncbi:MAG: choice-of-anchor Q domain-containing protein, partial [Terriglobia bacterium]
HHYGTLSIKNNIFSGFGIDISGITQSDWTSIDIDNNLHNISTAHGYGYLEWVGSKACKTLACVQSKWGWEMHAPAMAAPKFVAVPNGTAGSGNFHLLPGSPAIGTGINLSSVFTTDAAGRPRPSINLSSVFTTDAAGRPRPSTGPWDMGAYVEGSNQPRPVISGQPALQNKH